MKREWKASMGEISGFGGGYEAVCRAMVIAGIQWVDEHPEVELKAHSFENIYGVAIEDNEETKAMVKVMMDAEVYLDGKLMQKRAGDDCTGAMHHASLDHVLAYKRLGWDEYVRQLEKREKD